MNPNDVFCSRTEIMRCAVPIVLWNSDGRETLQLCFEPQKFSFATQPSHRNVITTPLRISAKASRCCAVLYIATRRERHLDFGRWYCIIPKLMIAEQHSVEPQTISFATQSRHRNALATSFCVAFPKTHRIGVPSFISRCDARGTSISADGIIPHCRQRARSWCSKTMKKEDHWTLHCSKSKGSW